MGSSWLRPAWNLTRRQIEVLQCVKRGQAPSQARWRSSLTKTKGLQGLPEGSSPALLAKSFARALTIRKSQGYLGILKNSPAAFQNRVDPLGWTLAIQFQQCAGLHHSAFLMAKVKEKKKQAAALRKPRHADADNVEVEKSDFPPATKLDIKQSFPVFAYATCEEVDMERLHDGLIAQDLYIPSVLSDDMDDVIHATAKYKIEEESREIFFFREGSVVFWNMPEQEVMNVLRFLKKYEHESYESDQVLGEVEYMRYNYHDQGSTRLSKGRIVLEVNSTNQILEKYTFANAMASSVKLGIWESTLDNFTDSIADITEVLKAGKKITMSREAVLKMTGELYSLRHELNLNSDLLDTPDFYWEREALESLYQKTCEYLNLSRRTKVLNEKMEHCSELLELLSTHLTDKHHTRLEWMIILLIMVEVGFEILHFAERYIM